MKYLSFNFVFRQPRGGSRDRLVLARANCKYGSQQPAMGYIPPRIRGRSLEVGSLTREARGSPGSRRFKCSVSLVRSNLSLLKERQPTSSLCSALRLKLSALVGFGSFYTQLAAGSRTFIVLPSQSTLPESYLRAERRFSSNLNSRAQTEIEACVLLTLAPVSQGSMRVDGFCGANTGTQPCSTRQMMAFMLSDNNPH